MLLERYYGYWTEEETTEALRSAEMRLINGLERCREIGIWDALRGAREVLWIDDPDRPAGTSERVLGDPHRFQWWAAPDLVHIPADGGIEIVDYKTGELREEECREQIHVYAAYRACTDPERMWGEGWRGRVVGLLEGRDLRVPITREDIDRALGLVESDVRRWRRLQVSAEPNLADLRNFPRTEGRSRCGFCAFRHVCEQTHNPGGRIGAPDP